MARILIVEDEAVVAMTMSMVLDFAGHQVVGIANDEASAVKQIARSRPDLALVDIKLANNSDGVETALRLKARHPVKVVFVSGHLDSHTQRRAATVDPAGYVTKPYSARHLLKVVSIACSHSAVTETEDFEFTVEIGASPTAWHPANAQSERALELPRKPNERRPAHLHWTQQNSFDHMKQEDNRAEPADDQNLEG